MTILRDISMLWSMLHTLVLFLFLFESRAYNDTFDYCKSDSVCGFGI